MGTPNIMELGRCAVVDSHLSSRYVLSITHNTLAALATSRSTRWMV